MWVGPPGAGKSTLALNYVLKAKIPTLYVSMDMRPRLVTNRVCAIETNTPVSQVAQEMDTEEGMRKYAEVLQGIDHLYVTFPARPDADGVAKSLMAFQEMHGVPPPLLVIDNLMNMNSGAKDEWTGLRDLSQVFHYFATELDIAVNVLHHINLGGLDLSYPAPENAIKGQISELPATILSFAKRPALLLGCAVKNRHGKADHSGRDYWQLSYDEDRQIISDYVPEPVQAQPQPQRSWNVKPVAEKPDWFARGVKD